MGCQCCRMIKSYIYDPSVAVEERKADSSGNSLYQSHHPTAGGLSKQKQGLHNLGYSRSNDSTLKLEFDNNQVNHRLHAAGSAPPVEAGPYIIQPEVRWEDRGSSQVPIYPSIQEYERQRSCAETQRNGWDSSISPTGKSGGRSSSVDEIDEGVGGTPEYMGDTGDEGSVLSVDIHTSTTSLSSAGTRDGLTPPKTSDVSTEESGISVTKSEDEEEVRHEKEEVQSVTDSMVAEALAALEAATAGEDSE
ncbi:hypothetical protein FQA47_008872 [Oryzias melastigma]|uniref:Uncharacterized protein n=1 Tax=Oryzias melastigma TaxID=30732 RepID=A0A834BUN6_ORYME|nr:hypothetical protein FQA47_008872 [Oryzias melastigma]